MYRDKEFTRKELLQIRRNMLHHVWNTAVNMSNWNMILHNATPVKLVDNFSAQKERKSTEKKECSPVRDIFYPRSERYETQRTQATIKSSTDVGLNRSFDFLQSQARLNSAPQYVAR